MKLIIAQVYEDSQSAIKSFDDLCAVIEQWSHQKSLNLKINRRELIIEYGKYKVGFYSKKHWLDQSACRWHYVNFNFPVTKELLGLKFAKERIRYDFKDEP